MLTFFMNNKTKYDAALYNIVHNHPKCIGDKVTLEPLGLSEELLLMLEDELPTSLEAAQKLLPGIDEVHQEGCTSIVYRYNYESHSYAIKVKRKDIPQFPKDLYYSFDIEMAFRFVSQIFEINGICKTLYTNNSPKVMISDWISGCYIKNMNAIDVTAVAHAFELMLDLQKMGFFIFDLNMSNIKYKDGMPYLYDFGYVYPFNPRIECNPYTINRVPDMYFDNLERYKTTHIMRYISNIERTNGSLVAIQQYELFADIFLQYQQKWLLYLKERDAAAWLCDRAELNIMWYSSERETATTERYILDKFLSYILTLEEGIYYDLYDEKFSVRLNELLSLVESSYDQLKKGITYFSYPIESSAEELIRYIKNRYQKNN